MSAALLYGLVILSAIANAVWNALMKSAGDRVLTMVAIRTVGLLFGLVALPFVDWPAPESWKWLALTAAVMFAYYALLIRSYGVGDMSVVYPLARGLAPMLTTIAAFFAIGETLGLGQVAAVAMISLGIMALSFGAGASGGAVGFALATGVSVATYSSFAGLGVRTAGTVLGFQACLEIVTGLGMLCYGITVRHAAVLAYARRYGALGLLTGAVSVVGFLAYLVAAQHLPLGPVTALRETSVIFGTVLGTVVLKEGFGPRRVAAALLVTAGIMLLAITR
ncbi:DMT family transporter [Reyranella soli]|uniref:Guanidinium exporter n=1 Tax=Reyranella soli TaxID=1230389 RepID=A0A512NJW0_9HYPH|nr:DMT family transporter [Reyranella soli]GEP59227.1 membrane protein [Reyranella soli]